VSALAGEPDPLWFKDAIIYEAHVRAFRDSDGNGIGDFPGLTERLDYLAELGVTAIWILPFYPSPGRDDGYDIADFAGVNPDYGTLADVRRFIREAHRRGLRVITELVCNHTSNQHAWFQRARRAKPGSPFRDFYVWSDTPDRYRDARIIFQDYETSNWTWDPVAGAYFWHRFYSEQPDLNFDNPRVREAIFQTMAYWLDMGVDGLRLDAIPYLYEREGTNCENLPETHAFLKELRRQIDVRFAGRMLLAEANQWPEDSVAYFGDGDECHMCFHFPVMPRLYMAVAMEDRTPILDILAQTPAIPESSQWAMFLRNHDELTLEMVTDEERALMLQAYAPNPRARVNLGIRRRLAPLMGNDRRRIELMNGLLYSMPGTPVLYYGDEIGMGDNIYLADRNGVRTPMQWSGGRNAGFSSADAQRLYLPVITDPEYHYEAVNVEAQERNPNSLLSWTKRIIALRKRHPAFGRGTIRFLEPDNRRILAFVREHAGESILVVANLSQYAQHTELDLPDFAGRRPTDLFGGVAFPAIGSTAYGLGLGPYEFRWFGLREVTAAAPAIPGRPTELPRLPAVRELVQLATGPGAAAFADLLADWARQRRWFRGKARHIRETTVRDAIPSTLGGLAALIVVLRVEYADGQPEDYLVPVVSMSAEGAALLAADAPSAPIAQLESDERGGGDGRVLVDALRVPAFGAALLDATGGRRRLRGRRGELCGQPTPAFRALRGPDPGRLAAVPSRAEQSNSSVVFGDRLILKVYRRLEPGINPDLELGRFLTGRGSTLVPPLAGSIEYVGRDGSSTAAIVQGFVAEGSDAWEFTLAELSEFLERAQAAGVPPAADAAGSAALLTRSRDEPPDAVRATIGPFLGTAELLGTRTAELHGLLASDVDDPALIPVPFSELYQRSLYQSVRTTVRESLGMLERGASSLPVSARPDAEAALILGPAAEGHLRRLTDRKFGGARIRCHGDLHLGQVLRTAQDAVFIDLEGEPGRPLSQRRLKRSALTDVAGMIRSFDYAASTALRARATASPALDRWAGQWYAWVSAAFLRGYRTVTAEAPFLPADDADWAVLLDAFLIQKAFYELAYELNNRPGWVTIPLRGLRALLEP
jgi:maltose alpha-D-glucosyltransferase / alpha-amylase